MSAASVMSSKRGGERIDNLREQCQRAHFVEHQDENMPPKVIQSPKVNGSLLSLNVESHLKLRLQSALASTSASVRLKAIRAINTGEMDKFTSYDVLHSTQEIVTDEERRQAAETPQKSFQEVMDGVRVYVEVRSGREDRTEAIKAVISGKGVKVNDRLLRNTTHIIFKEGRLSTYKTAQKWNIPIVSILWFEACKNCSTLMDPERFRPDGLDRFEHPELYKIKRPKFIRCEGESPLRWSSKSLLVNGGSPSVTPKILSKTHVDLARNLTPCDTPETKLIKNILVTAGKIEKTETPVTDVAKSTTKKTLEFEALSQDSTKKDTTWTPGRSTRRASCTSVQSLELSDAPTSFKSLRKSISMELTLPAEKLTFSKLDNISEEMDEMEVTEIAAPERRTILQRESMVESPGVQEEQEDKPKNRWTQINGESKMDIIDDDKSIFTPSRIIFSSTATPGSSRRATIFQHRLEMINQEARKASKVKEFEDLTPTPTTQQTDIVKVKPRRRTLCPLPTVETFPEEREESQAKRRKLFNPSAVNEAAKTPKPLSQPKTPKKTPGKAEKSSQLTKKSDKRRSTLEFESGDRKNQAAKKTVQTLVITNVYGKEKELVEEAVKKLGAFQMERTVTRTTSHLVCQNPGRTLNMMRGVIRGVWILSLDWVKESVAASRWLPEEPFELKSFAPAVRMNRCERQLLGSSYKMDLLRNFDPIYVSPRCSIGLKETQELVVLCGGRIVNKSLAKYIMGDRETNCPPGAICLNPNWLLSSILARKVLPTSDFLISKG